MRHIPHAVRVAVVSIGIAGMLAATAPVASANLRGVINRGPCSGDSHRVLKVWHRDHGVIHVAFAVHEGVVGDHWRVRIWHGRRLMFLDVRVTKQPNGSFVIRRPARNTRGPDFFRARALNVETGEVCAARAVI
jgi:hypothetical protein